MRRRNLSTQVDIPRSMMLFLVYFLCRNSCSLPLPSLFYYCRFGNRKQGSLDVSRMNRRRRHWCGKGSTVSSWSIWGEVPSERHLLWLTTIDHRTAGGHPVARRRRREPSVISNHPSVPTDSRNLFVEYNKNLNLTRLIKILLEITLERRILKARLEDFLNLPTVYT